MTRITWIGGALAASAAAGPIVVALIALASFRPGWGWEWQQIGMFATLLVFSLPFGFSISMLPNVAGTALLAWAGRRYPIARHPLVWAATGELFGWLIVSGFSGQADAGGAVFALVGAACALVCRWRTRWFDDGLSYTPRT